MMDPPINKEHLQSAFTYILSNPHISASREELLSPFTKPSGGQLASDQYWLLPQTL